MRGKHFLSWLLCAALLLGFAPLPAVPAKAAVADVTQYSYEITPILSPFCYCLYVKTDNPDPSSFRLVDRDSALYGEDSHSHISQAISGSISTVCGWSRYEYISPTQEHQWDEGVVTREPTCSVTGRMLFTCAVCGQTETRLIEKLEHSFGEWETTRTPTCTAEGRQTRTCTVCGSSETEAIPALGHDYKDSVCARCGEADPNHTPGTPGNPFTDVREGTYYYDPVLWAVNHTPQITNGTDPTHFSPDKTCTRAQVVTFLWRAMGCPAPERTDCPFTDVRPGQYYYQAVLWAMENGITNGVSETSFGTERGCTRAQVVTFLWRTQHKPEPTGTTNPFGDVAEGQYYHKAVLWAVEKGITKGTSNDRFSPDSTCTRAQIVTFLYRAN